MLHLSRLLQRLHAVSDCTPRTSRSGFPTIAAKKRIWTPTESITSNASVLAHDAELGMGCTVLDIPVWILGGGEGRGDKSNKGVRCTSMCEQSIFRPQFDFGSPVTYLSPPKSYFPSQFFCSSRIQYSLLYSSMLSSITGKAALSAHFAEHGAQSKSNQNFAPTSALPHAVPTF